MTSVVLMALACINAWLADRSFKKGRPTFGALCVGVAVLSFLKAWEMI